MSDNAAPQFDPVMVLARVEGFTDATGAGDSRGAGSSGPASGPVYAVWQVETDPNVTLGDFSGAWLITPEGIQGFAGSAEWIEGRDDPRAILTTLLRYPVLPTEGTSAEDVRGGVETKGLEIVDLAATERAAAEAVEETKAFFAQEFPGKRQPAWGEIAPLQADEARAPEGAGQDPAVQEAIAAALATAKGLRAWIRQWNAFDKLRVRRLGAVSERYAELTGLPLRFVE